ncbi:MAG: hypothetical protein K5838_04840 [Elusimicrobiales bacterium]|nr:hypothetical protein [Elusimicrobiales bacterium]
MIKDMELKLTVQKEKENSFQILDFAREHFIIGSGLVKTSGSGHKLSSLLEHMEKLPTAVLLTGIPEDGEMTVLSLLWQYPSLPVHLTKGAYAIINHYLKGKAEASRLAGRRQEGQAFEDLLSNFHAHAFNEKFSIGELSLEFLKAGPMLGAAAVRISNGDDSVLIAEAFASSELLKCLELSPKKDNFSAHSDIFLLDLPENYVPGRSALAGNNGNNEENSMQQLAGGQHSPVSLEELANIIKEAKQNLGFFFIPVSLPRLPLMIKSLNELQKKGFIPSEIRICPVGSEAKKILSIYEDNGIGLNYASAYLRSNIQPASLPREANCGFRIFVVPGEDFSDLRGCFSAALLQLVKRNPLATMAYPGLELPAGLKGIENNGGCRIFACDLLGTPSEENLLQFISKGTFSDVVIAGGKNYGYEIPMSSSISGIGSGSYKKAYLPSRHGEIISFYKDESGKAFHSASSKSNVLAITAGKALLEEGIVSAAKLLSKIPDKTWKTDKAVLFCRNETLEIAEKLSRSFFESGLPAEIRLVSDFTALVNLAEGLSAKANCKAEEKNFVSSVSELLADFADMRFFLGGDRILDAWANQFVILFMKKAWYAHCGKISALLPVSFKLEERQLEAYWGNIREIALENRKEFLKAVPSSLLNLVLFLDEKEGRYKFNAYGLMLDSYCRHKGMSMPVSSMPLSYDMPKPADALPKAAVFTVGTSLIDNYYSVCKISNEKSANVDISFPEPSADELLAFIKKDAHNAYQGCCDELKTLFSLSDPALLKNCRNVVFLAQDTKEGKLISAALESFFKTIGLASETVFIDPFEDSSEYGLYDLGLRNMSVSLGNLKQKHGELLFLICGGDEIACSYARLAALLFKDEAYAGTPGSGPASKLPRLPLDLDISSYADSREFLDMILDLSLDSRYEKLPAELKEMIIRKTEHGMSFTAIQPLIETVYLLKNPEAAKEAEQKNKSSINGPLMAYSGNGGKAIPFFLVRSKKHVNTNAKDSGSEDKSAKDISLSENSEYKTDKKEE